MKIALYDPYLDTLGGGENVLAALCEALEAELPDATLDLITHKDAGVGVEALCQRFGVTLTRTRVRVVPPPSSPWDPLLRFDLLRRAAHERKLAEISEEYDLFVNNTIFSTMPCRATHGIYICMFPLNPGEPTAHWKGLSYWPRKLNAALRRRYFHRSLSSYSAVVANSEFTRDWTRRYWGLDASILYPPVATKPMVDLSRKEHRILSVGRFFPGNHNKKHRPMVETFIRMVDNGLKDWEYHLVGGITPVEGAKEYVEDLQRLAENYPVHFHFDASPEVLEELQATSSIFWHATGFGEDREADPDKMEHFGMSTVEAMTHGIVPVVINLGGQPEVVTHGHDGLMWSTLDELAAHSRELIGNPARRVQLANAAHARSLAFGRSAFRGQVARLLDQILSHNTSVQDEILVP